MIHDLTALSQTVTAYAYVTAWLVAGGWKFRHDYRRKREHREGCEIG